MNEWIGAQATPLLAIKRPGDRGSIRVSEAPTSIANVPATLNKALGLGGTFSNPSIFDLDEHTERIRSFYVYPWARADWTSDYATPIRELLVEGSPYTGTWRLGREFKPPPGE